MWSWCWCVVAKRKLKHHQIILIYTSVIEPIVRNRGTDIQSAGWYTINHFILQLDWRPENEPSWLCFERFKYVFLCLFRKVRHSFRSFKLNRPSRLKCLKHIHAILRYAKDEDDEIGRSQCLLRWRHPPLRAGFGVGGSLTLVLYLFFFKAKTL